MSTLDIAASSSYAVSWICQRATENRHDEVVCVTATNEREKGMSGVCVVLRSIVMKNTGEEQIKKSRKLRRHHGQVEEV